MLSMGGSRFAIIYTRPSAPKLRAGAWQSGAGGLVALPWMWGQRCGANTGPWQGTWLLPAAGSWAPGQLQPLLSKHFGAKCRKRAPAAGGSPWWQRWCCAGGAQLPGWMQEGTALGAALRAGDALRWIFSRAGSKGGLKAGVIIPT